MRKRWLGLIAAVAVAALAASAAPAFTADTGTVAVTVTAQAAATPCITVAPTTLDFGTLPFSKKRAAFSPIKDTVASSSDVSTRWPLPVR